MIFVAFATAGCSSGADPGRGPAGASVDDGQALRDGFRVRLDPARGRVWLLALEGVRLYDARSGRLTGRLGLPNWSVARQGCDPDLVLEPSGSAIISSNVQPKLWRVDADTLAVAEYDITLLERERLDLGFGALAMTGEGKVLALTTVSEAPWVIDLGGKIARMSTMPGRPVSLCGLSPQFIGSPAPRPGGR